MDAIYDWLIEDSRYIFNIPALLYQISSISIKRTEAVELQILLGNESITYEKPKHMYNLLSDRICMLDSKCTKMPDWEESQT